MLPSMGKKLYINTEEKKIITIDEKVAWLINQPKKNKYINIQRFSTDCNRLIHI